MPHSHRNNAGATRKGNQGARKNPWGPCGTKIREKVTIVPPGFEVVHPHPDKPRVLNPAPGGELMMNRGLVQGSTAAPRETHAPKIYRDGFDETEADSGPPNGRSGLKLDIDLNLPAPDEEPGQLVLTLALA